MSERNISQPCVRDEFDSLDGNNEEGPRSDKLEELLPDGVTGIEWQAGRFKFHRTSKEGGGQKGGGLRGRVTGMSDASRRRFMGKFASLDFEYLASRSIPIHFLTLTTPVEYWSQGREVYKALRRFRDRLEYCYGSKGYLGAFVRREYGGKRGMLHYHPIVIGCESLPHAWVESTWSECLRYDGKVRVDVQRPESAERVAKYLCKYVSKVGYEGKLEGPKAPAEVCVAGSAGALGAAPLSKAHNVGNEGQGYTGGRWWYIWGKDTLPWGESIIFVGEFGKAIAKRVRRIFRRWLVEQTRSRLRRSAELLVMDIGKIFTDRMSVRQLAKITPFAEYLRRGGGGYTLFVSPELLQQMVDAACLSYIATIPKGA